MFLLKKSCYGIKWKFSLLQITSNADAIINEGVSFFLLNYKKVKEKENGIII